MRTITILSVMAMIFGLINCDRLHRGWQVRAHADIQILAARVEEEKAKLNRLPFQDEFRRLENGKLQKDPWGNPFLYCELDGHYLIASLGSDGKLDVKDLHDYLGKRRINVSGQIEKDIVLVDGLFVQSAGK